ncbi:transposase [Amphritea sp.]|uniref:transposase n=1 Tax=Amphritea sp. TaxID=1872502 RepID=UPI00356A501A
MCRLIIRYSRHIGYKISQRTRKRVEEPFGWDKTVGLIRQMKVRGLAKVNSIFMPTMIGWNLTRMRRLQG